MKMHYRLLVSVAAALLLIFSLAGSAYGESPKMVKVIIGWDDDSQNSVFNGLKVSARGGKIGRDFHLLPASVAEVPENQIAFLKKMAGVAFVEVDSEVQALEDSVPWGISRVQADQVWSITQGAGVKVAVIDTGVDLDHPDVKVYGNVSFVTGASTGDDDHGHGTHVAGTIAALDNGIGVIGVAPKAQIYAVKVLDSSGSGYISSVIDGIEWAVDNGMNVINMSLGDDSGSTAFQLACDNAYNAGVLVVAAAGNSGPNSVGYPAKYDSVIAVSAVSSSNTVASWSSTGPKVELAAPGVSVYSTYKNGGYASFSGTSMASPHVAGVVALLFAAGVQDNNNNSRVNDEIRSILTTTATDLGTAGRDYQYGYGLVNVLVAVESISGGVNNVPIADAGEDQSVVVNLSVTLDGSGSTDSDADTLTYSWLQTSGEAVDLSDNTVASPEFTPVLPGEYIFQLTVSDSQAEDSDSVVIEVKDPALNSTPVADAGEDRTVYTQQRVTLDGSDSSDADGDSLTYSWVQTSGSAVNISDSSAVKPVFTATIADIYVFQLTVSDGLAESIDEVTVTVKTNNAPVANAGLDQSVIVKRLVTLDGSASSDRDGDTLTYYWTQTSGRSVSISKKNTANATFTPSVIGSYCFRLTVSDGIASSTDMVTVSVKADTSATTLMVKSIVINAVKKNNRSTTLTAVVTVTDLNGKAVSGVTVKGHWTGSMTGSSSGRTGSAGTVKLVKTSTVTKAGSTFTFVVDKLSRSGYTYDASKNLEGSDSVTLAAK